MPVKSDAGDAAVPIWARKHRKSAISVENVGAGFLSLRQ
jgi:hypothetical protein